MRLDFWHKADMPAALRNVRFVCLIASVMEVA